MFFSNINLKLSEEQQALLELVTDLWNKALSTPVKKYAAVKGDKIEYKKGYTPNLIYTKYSNSIDKMIEDVKKGRTLGYLLFQKKGKLILKNKEAILKLLKVIKDKKNLFSLVFADNEDDKLVMYYYFFNKRATSEELVCYESGKERIKKMFDMFVMSHPYKINL